MALATGARMAAAISAAAALAGCEPAPTPQAAAANAAQQAAEALKAQGARDAAVQIQPDSFRAQLTQADGRQATVTVGVGTVSPADHGLPWYPGAQPDPARSSKVSAAEGQVATVVLTTADPLERVAAFYRERLGAFSPGAAREGRSPEGATTFVVADDAATAATQVWLTRTATGSEITVLTTRRAPR
jgi:hypothetical protein